MERARIFNVHFVSETERERGDATNIFILKAE